MLHKKYSPKQRLKIVVEGLRGKIKIAELCTQYEITQVTYYKRRDRLLEEGEKVFEYGGIDAEKKRLRKQNTSLKETVGELTMELKKNDW